MHTLPQTQTGWSDMDIFSHALSRLTPQCQKCDTVKPACGQCTRANRDDECEYTDGSYTSQARVLENDVTRLEERIQQLEHPSTRKEVPQVDIPFPPPAMPPVPTPRKTASWHAIGKLSLFRLATIPEDPPAETVQLL